jgi:hypothetical protein
MSDTKNPLSKSSLQSEGVEIKLTQNDIIEALVEQQIEQIENQFKSLDKEYEDIVALMEKEVNDFRETKVKSIKIPKSASVGKWSYSVRGDYKEKDLLKTIRINEDSYAREHGRIKYYNSMGLRIVMNCKISFYASVSLEIEGLTFKSEVSTKDFNFKHSEELAKMIEDYNEKCEAFMCNIPKNGINEKEIAKKIKNQFTREMLTAMSSELKDALNKNFKLGLGK